MNLLRQQEKLKEWRKIGLMEESHYHAAIHAPVFEWEPMEKIHYLTPEESEFINTHIAVSDSLVPTVAPFDCFRISMKGHFDQWFRYPGHRKWILMRCAYAEEKTGPEQWYANIYAMDAGGRSEYRAWRDGKHITPMLLKLAEKENHEFVKLMRSLVEMLSYFLLTIMLPGNTVLKVEPTPKPGKSVEWRLARTHYLILNRKQAEQCRDRKSTPSEAQLVRAAHWRRAHFRRLVAARYKTKRLVPVKQAWVGPEEWIGLDGKVYKVVNLPATSPASPETLPGLK